MKLSIITINYNNKIGFQKTVASMMSQTWRDFEWIIIDGGSTDGSVKLIENLANHLDSNISYWCSERDGGIYNAMNKGICRAKGVYFCFLNSGDTFFSSETLNQVFGSKQDGDIIYGDCELFTDNNSKRVSYPHNISLSFLIKQGICHQASFFKSTLFENFRYNENYRLVSDWEALLKWIILGKKFAHLDFVVAKYDGSGISSISSSLLQNERLLVLSNLFSQDPRPFISEIEQKQAALDSYNQYEYQSLRRIINRGHFRKSLVRGLLKLIDFIDRKSGQYY